MRSRIVTAACVLGMFVYGCGSTNPGPGLSISPSGTGGTVQVTGPTAFTAELVNSTAEVTWTVEGGGTISSTAGLHIIYVPPPGSMTATLTAAAAGMTAAVQISWAPETISIPGLSAPVTVAYDAKDIPHIKCAATNDCVAVQGYIQARDRLFQMDFIRHVGRSRLAEMIGLDGLSQDVQLRTLLITRAGHRVEEDLAMAMDPATKVMLTAYVRGINAYLAELRAKPGARLPGEYAQLPFPLTPADIEDWTMEDTLAVGRLQQFSLSEGVFDESANGQFAAVYGPGGSKQDLGKFRAWIRTAAPPTERAHTLSATAFHPPGSLASMRAPAKGLSKWKDVLGAVAARADSLRGFMRPADATVGSNNWVVAAAKSATGVAMVANDPHQPLEYPPEFHLSVMTSTNPADNLDLAGGVFPGVPGALVGRGAHVGWGVTVVGYDVTDLYREQIVSCPPGGGPTPCVSFKVNGVATAVQTIAAPQTFLVRTGPGGRTLFKNAKTLGASVPDAVLVVPHHGPIIQTPDAAGRTISARWTGQEGNTQDIKAFFGLNTAVDVDAAIVALKDFSTGAQNFVLADDKGHIAYDPHALVPVRNFADKRVNGANVIPPWFPLPADGSAEWGDGTSDCAAATLTPVPASCWIADDVLPHGKDPAKGYFFTANADPTSPSVSDDNDPLAHPPYLSFGWSDTSGFRATRIEQMIEKAIADHGKVSLEDMEAIQSDHVSRLGMLFTAFIAQLPATASSPPELAAAQAVLNQWATNGWDCPSGLLGIDPKASPVDPTPKTVQNSSGCYLFHVFLRALATNVFTDDLAVVGQRVNGLAALKAMLYMLDPATAASDTTFCNDVDAKGQLATAHTCTEQVVIALVQAVDTLSSVVGKKPSDWVWGRAHTIRPSHPLALITTDFQPGPYARPGGAFTVDVGNPSLASSGLDFAYGSGGAVRHISLMDPAKPVVRMQLPGPERDGPTVFVQSNLLSQWVQNIYFDFAFGAQIDGNAVSNQTFKAP